MSAWFTVIRISHVENCECSRKSPTCWKAFKKVSWTASCESSRLCVMCSAIRRSLIVTLHEFLEGRYIPTLSGMDQIQIISDNSPLNELCEVRIHIVIRLEENIS